MNTLIQITLYLTVTALFLLLFKRLFKNKLSAKWQVYVWGILLIRLLLPSLPQSEISVYNALPVPEVYTAVQQETVADMTDIHVDTTESAPKGIDTNRLALMIWGSGTIALLLYFVIIYLLHLRAVRKLNPITSELLEECKQTLHIKQRMQLLSGGETPMLTGVVKPRILLPSGYSEQEERSILLHELCHLKHGDILITWVFVLILCLQWFNPVMWYSFFLLRRDIEVYCDQRVLAHTEDKKEYAALLLKTALRKNKFVLGTTSLQNGEKEVARRIRYIAYFKKPKVIVSLLLALIAAVIAALCLTNALEKEPYSELYEYRNTYIGDASGVRNLLEMVDSSGYPIHSIELQTDSEPYRLTVKYKVDDRSEYRMIKRQPLNRTSALLFALIPNADVIVYYFFDNYGDINNPETTFDGSYYSRDDLSQRNGMGVFTLDVVNHAADLPESFAEYCAMLENIPPDRPLSAIQEKRYAFIGDDCEIVTNSGVGLDVPITEENREIYQKFGEIFGMDFAKYSGFEIHFSLNMVRNFKTNEDRSVLFAECDEVDPDHLLIAAKYPTEDEEAAFMELIRHPERVFQRDPFTASEVDSAKAVVEEYFRAIKARDREAALATMTPWHNMPNLILWQDEERTLDRIDYVPLHPNRQTYITNGRGKVNGTAIGNVIVLTVQFTVTIPHGGKSAYNPGEYTNYSMILIREAPSSPWLIDDMGY